MANTAELGFSRRQSLGRFTLMRNLLQMPMLLSSLVSALAVEPSFDSSFLNQLPAQRARAVTKFKATATDSASNINTKQEKYYSALKQMIQSIRSRYYFHTEFPKDLCAALEQHAVVLAGIEFPFSAATASSGYDHVLIKTKIRFAEEMICRMSQVIHDEALRDEKTGKSATKSADMYTNWLKNWNASDTP